MPVFTWGLLAKSQVDDEKIEEAIARLIQEHDDDETAHLETGQSLQSHKASEIIDHIAQSIVEDKIKDLAITSPKISTDQIVAKDFRTASDVGSGVDGVKFYSGGIEVWESGQKVVDLPVSGAKKFLGEIAVNILTFLRHTWIGHFESVDGYIKSLSGNGDSITPLFQALDIVTSATIGNKTRLCVGEVYNVSLLLAKNPSIQFSYHGHDLWGQDVYMVWGSDDPFIRLNDPYFGFFVDHNNYNKIYAVYRESSTSEVKVEMTGINPEDKHFYRAVMSGGGSTIKFYVDNVLKHTASPSFSLTGTDYLFCFAVKSQAEESHSNFFWDLVIQQDL